MADGDELNNEEYASIYGEEALTARKHARLKRLYDNQVEGIARLDALAAKMDARNAALTVPPLPTEDEQMVRRAEHIERIAGLDARIARLDAMIARAQTLPSWPDMAREIRFLRVGMALLKDRVQALEQECDALRKRELLRFFEERDEDAAS